VWMPRGDAGILLTMAAAIEPLVLVVEDDDEIAMVLEAYLRRDGFRVARAVDGAQATQRHRELAPALVLLDVKLPKRDGFEVLKDIRQRAQTPVIMVTALGEDLEKLLALRSGADDYVIKPFNPLEVVARVRAVLRRTSASSSSGQSISVGRLTVDLRTHRARVSSGEAAATDPAEGDALDLTLTEFRLLAQLIGHPDTVFSRAELLEKCLSRESDALDRTVDSHLSKLRRKLEAAGLPGHVVNVRGVGYRLLP
jgi:two-component system, OmpR family, response regulator AdeR